jgi:hypothetical protein
MDIGALQGRALLVAIALWASCHRPHAACPLAPEPWRAPAPFYDYLNVVSFDGRGRGELLYGDHQAIRAEVRFRYRASDRAISFDYEGHAPRTIGYAISAGDFKVWEPGPGGGTETRYRCRLRFAADPFPPDAYHHPQRDYYCRRAPPP